MPTEPTSDIHPALVYLRAHREGVLIADGTVIKIRFVLDRTGRIVFPAALSTAGAAELVLFVPEESPADVPELQLLLLASPLDASACAACARWEAYHGEPPLPRWLACSIDSAKFESEVLDGEVFASESPLRKAEPALCALLNADTKALGELCRIAAGVAPREPRAVGVDDLGIDIRARFGIVRIPFVARVVDQETAEGTIRGMLDDARKRAGATR